MKTEISLDIGEEIIKKLRELENKIKQILKDNEEKLKDSHLH
tara:strand:+ start:855 stop:980 length:126 start_codon:yes stop_codon:yes gene_type:complete